MVTKYTCTECLEPISISNEMAGQLCSCPHCQGEFMAPTNLSVSRSLPISAPDLDFTPARPINIQLNVPPRLQHKRDNGAVWFLKWVFAPVAALLGLWIGFRVLTALNTTLDTDGARAKQQAAQQFRGDIIEQAAAAVKLRGVTEPSREMHIKDAGNGLYIITGRGMAVNDLVHFRVELIRTKFSDRVNWHARKIDVKHE